MDAMIQPSTASATLGAIDETVGWMQASFEFFAWLFVALIRILPFGVYWVFRFTTITLPTWLLSLLHLSLTFTLNFTTLALIFFGCGSTVVWFVRYRLDTYAKLPSEPARNPPPVEVFPEHEEQGSKPGITNYLDEFLSAIKVFGYLERPVFHELTRSMQTKKLIAGETLLLEEEKGFCLVVDGLVQIFVKSSNRDAGSGSEDSDDDDVRSHKQGYQLLTEVGNGAPMSSLFSILSLFTEHLQMRHESDNDRPGPASSKAEPSTPTMPPASGAGMPDGIELLNPMESPRRKATPRNGRDGVSFSTSVNETLPQVPPMSLEDHCDQTPEVRVPLTRPAAPVRRNSIHPDIVARATVDTTIAIIPASAFKRLTRTYPKATGHIVSVILTRLQRVTLATAHSYLGLTSEVLRTESLMNKYTTYDLPDFLRDSALERLKLKFASEREKIGEVDISKGIALHNPSAGSRHRTKRTLRREASIRVAAAQHANSRDGMSPPRVRSPTSETGGVNAGDLLSNGHAYPLGRRAGRLSFSQPLKNHVPTLDAKAVHDRTYFSPGPLELHREDSEDEDAVFRESILDCMFKAIGLKDLKDTSAPPASAAHSPRLVSFDTRRQKAVFSNALGLMNPYDVSVDGDSESIASASQSALSGDPTYNLLEELVNDVEIVFFPKNSVLVEQGERNPGLYYVIDGFLDVSVVTDEGSSPSGDMGGVAGLSGVSASRSELFGKPGSPSGFGQNGAANAEWSPSESGKKRKKRETLFLIEPGGIAGYLGTISSYRSFIDVTAKTDVYVGFLPRSSVERLADKYPVVLLTMAKRLTTLLLKLIRHIDFAIEWVQVNAGKVIYEQDDQSDAIYLVLNGRLRAIRENKGAVAVIGEYGQGESVGELEVLTESNRPGTLLAIRDTELAKLPKSLFNSLAREHPGITMKISKIIAKRMRALLDDPVRESLSGQQDSLVRSNPSSIVNLRTVAILPVTAGIPVVDFASRLMAALTQIGTQNGVVSLNQTTILNHLGRHAFNRMGKLKLSQHLADLEERYGLVIYVADTTVQSPWTQTCISQADCILLVGVADGSPAIGEFERFLLTTKTTARKELVLLHAERYVSPGSTRTWLRNRVWINGGHHHIQMATRSAPLPLHTPPGRRFQTAIKQRVQTIQAEIQKYTSRRVRETPLYSAETPLKGDFHRLARRLTGRAVGLVLGGGGARGIAHIGVIRALEEAGIPIDIVGGTSIGALVGALYAWDADVVPTYGRVKKFSGRMASIWRFVLDVTYPAASYTTGHEFNRGIFKTFGNAQMEDFWLDFYCNTTNISRSCPEFHSSGYVWRYVRASMSLAGLLPPLCDGGAMLMDGGYIDNLPVSHMKSLGADVVFAVDVGALDENTPQQFGDTLSGFWTLFNRWNPFSAYPNPPTLAEIQARLAYVSSYGALERAKAAAGCRYMRPEVDAIGTLDFGKFEDAYQIGYKYGRKHLAELREQGVLPILEESEEKKNLRRTMAPRRASI